MIGECKFCRQTMLVEDAEDQTAADLYATRNCKCEDGRKFRNIEDMKEAAKANAEALFPEIEGATDAERVKHSELMRVMDNIINIVAAGVIQKCTLKINERTTASIFITAKDGIRIKKNYKEEYVLEANRY